MKVAAEALGEKLSAMELNLYQVRNQSSKDVLALPVKLNNRLTALMRVAQSAEARPTDQISVVFRKLVEELDVELHALAKVVETDLSEFNTLLAAAGLEAVR